MIILFSGTGEGELRHIPNLEPIGLEEVLNDRMNRFIRLGDISEEEVYVFIDYVKGMLTIDPSRRKSAAELLEHEWLM